MKKGKKPKKRKRGAASRSRTRNIEKILKRLEQQMQRLKELKEETSHCFNSILEKYTLSLAEKNELEYEWGLGLQFISDYEDAPPKILLKLEIETYKSKPISDLLVDEEDTEDYYRASFDLSNALGLSLIKIDENGNVNGEIITYY